jgi:hypothetical protein
LAKKEDFGYEESDDHLGSRFDLGVADDGRWLRSPACLRANLPLR